MATTQLNPSEISDLIKARIDNIALAAEARNEGSVTSVSDGIVRVHGLGDAMQGEMIELPGNTYALALNLERDSVGAVVLGDYEHLREGDIAKTTGRILEVPVGPELLGRVVNALGEPIDGKGPIAASLRAPVERVAPGVIWRKSVDQPVQTGYKSVDAMIPIGRGQRELIIGDRQTGKTAMAIDAVINQKDTGIKCVYVAIGQKASTVANIVRKLEENGALAHTIVVAATASESAAMQYISAYSGCTMGEYFMDRGEDALIVSVQTGRCLPPDFPFASPPAGPRSVSGRRVLPALAFARTRGTGFNGICGEIHRRQSQRPDRLIDRAADY